MSKIKNIKRTINYYYLNFEYLDDFNPDDGDKFRELFRIVIALAKTKASIRYQNFGEKSIFIQDVKIEPENKVIIGKLRSIRKDLLPEIMNTSTDVTRGIEAKDEEGLVETTHFLIDYNKSKPKLAIEYNQSGAKVIDFVKYMQNIGIYKKAIRVVGFTPIVRDELSKIKERINRCSEFIVKVHKDNIEEIKSLDDKIHTVLKLSREHFNNDYATLSLKYDYKVKHDTKEINDSIFNLISKLMKDKTKVELFNTLSVKAEDSDKNNNLEIFDLLIDKVRSVVTVQKKERYRTVISEDIYDKMKKEFIKNKI